MTSRIATKLLSLPKITEEVADLVWRYSDLSGNDEIYAKPSIKYVKELVMFLDGPRVTEIVSLIPSSTLLDQLFDFNNDDNVIKGMVKNPYSSIELLDKIGMISKYKKVLESTYIEHQVNFNEKGIFSLRILQTYLKNNEVSKFYAAVNSFGESKTSSLFKSLYNEDQKLASLAVLTSIEAGNKLDLTMVSYIYETESFMNEAARIKLESFLENHKKIESYLTPSAIDYLMSKGHIQIKNQPKLSSGTDESMARTLMATGLDESVIAPLLLGSDSSEIESVFLTKILSKSSDGLIAQFVTGSTERKPRKGEISLLFSEIGVDRVKKITEEHAQSLLSLDWSEELIISAPLVDISKLGSASTTRLFELLADKLQNDSQAWELFLVMSEEWEDTIDSLLNSANIMSVLA